MQHDNQSPDMTFVCLRDDIPDGEMRCFAVRNSRILIANTKRGYFASDEMCTHEDASLCDGNLTDSLVKCPLHGSRFDLRTGEVLDDPADENLRIYPLVIDNERIYVKGLVTNSDEV